MFKLFVLLSVAISLGFGAFLHAPEGFKGLIPADLEELNNNFTEEQEELLQDAVLLLGEGQGKAVEFLRKRDPQLARMVSNAFQNVERDLDKMSKPAIKFIAQVMEYLRTSPNNLKPDKNGNPQVPKEVHEISIVNEWAKLDNKTKAEITDVFPSIAKTLRSDEFKEHATREMSKHGWTIN